MSDAKPLLSVSEPLGRALEIVRSNLQRDDAPLQHVLVVAPRGGGKTTFLRALSEAIAADRDLGTRAAVANVSALEVGTAGPDRYMDRLAAAFDRSIVQPTLNFGQFDEASWIAALGRLDKARAKSVRGRRRLGVLMVDGFDDALTRAFAPKDAPRSRCATRRSRISSSAKLGRRRASRCRWRSGSRRGSSSGHRWRRRARLEVQTWAVAYGAATLAGKSDPEFEMAVEKSRHSSNELS